MFQLNTLELEFMLNLVVPKYYFIIILRGSGCFTQKKLLTGMSTKEILFTFILY